MYPVFVETPFSVSMLPVEFETYMDQLLAVNEQLLDQSHHKDALVAQAVQDLRGPLTNLNLRLYLLEHAATDKQPKHIDSLKESVAELSQMVEDLLIQVRQSGGTAENVPADYFDLNGFTGHYSLSDAR